MRKLLNSEFVVYASVAVETHKKVIKSYADFQTLTARVGVSFEKLRTRRGLALIPEIHFLKNLLYSNHVSIAFSNFSNSLMVISDTILI